MVTDVKNNLEKIINACKQMHVKSLYLFGSRARNENYTDKSDLDFLFSFAYNADGNLLFPDYDYFDLKFELEKITGKKVDLVSEDKIVNTYFLERLAKEKVY